MPGSIISENLLIHSRDIPDFTRGECLHCHDSIQKTGKETTDEDGLENDIKHRNCLLGKRTPHAKITPEKWFMSTERDTWVPPESSSHSAGESDTKFINGFHHSRIRQYLHSSRAACTSSIGATRQKITPSKDGTQARIPSKLALNRSARGTHPHEWWTSPCCYYIRTALIRARQLWRAWNVFQTSASVRSAP